MAPTVAARRTSDRFREECHEDHAVGVPQFGNCGIVPEHVQDTRPAIVLVGRQLCDRRFRPKVR